MLLLRHSCRLSALPLQQQHIILVNGPNPYLSLQTNRLQVTELVSAGRLQTTFSLEAVKEATVKVPCLIHLQHLG